MNNFKTLDGKFLSKVTKLLRTNVSVCESCLGMSCRVLFKQRRISNYFTQQDSILYELYCIVIVTLS